MAGPIPPEPFQFGLPAQGTPPVSAEMRRLLTALAQTNMTRDAAVPSNPRDGMLRINAANLTSVNVEMYWQGAWIVLFSNIINAAPWPFYSIHDFAVAATSWVVVHGRNRKPLVQVINSAGQSVTPTSIIHNTDNQLTITHGSAIIGSVIVIG